MPTHMLGEHAQSFSATHINTLGKGKQPSLRPIVHQPLAAEPAAARHAEPTVQTSAEHELDAFLHKDPNTGAVHGLRFALLFNAGLALTGVLAWELWTLLAA